MRVRRTAVAALLAAGIVVPAVGTAGAAAAQPGPSSAAARAAVDRAAPKPVKTRKPVVKRFEAIGRVTAVDAAAGTVTLLAKGGTKDVRRRVVTVTVADTARVVVNGRRAAPATIAVGARIVVAGTRSAGVYTAIRVQVTQKRTPVVAPTPSPTPTVDPTPTVPPTPAPTVDPTPTGDPTPTVDPTPTGDPTPTVPAPDDDPIVDPEDENSGDLSD